MLQILVCDWQNMYRLNDNQGTLLEITGREAMTMRALVNQGYKLRIGVEPRVSAELDQRSIENNSQLLIETTTNDEQGE